MAVLLVAMSIMAVMLTVAMPVWKQASQREKEEELVFRGLQYAHAIGMFQRKYANAYPPNFDVLVNEKFLRKKFKDPITNDDFAPILAGQQGAGAPQQPGGRGGATGPGGQQPTTLSTNATPQAGAAGRPAGGAGGAPVGGIMGVTSKSKDKSIRLYNGRSHYNEWQFVYVPQTQAPGVGGGAAGPGGGTGQRGTGQNPFQGGVGPGGQRGGRGGQGPNRGGPGGPGGPNRGFNPGGFNPGGQGSQPIFPPGRGRG